MQIETRSIEFIPLAERYGTASRLFSLWFSATMQVSSLALGTLGIIGGLGFPLTLVAILCGNCIGTIFMAAHSAQGPHLGVPQMIQSRAQFGVYGAAIPLTIVLVVYVVFTAANAVLMRGSINALLHTSDNVAIVLFSIATLIISFVGYELIHRLGKALTVMSTLLFLATAILIVKHWALHLPPIEYSVPTSRLPVFLMMFAQAVSWTLGLAPVVADYSRYLPPSCSSVHTFAYTYGGTFIGSSITMTLGAMLATFSMNATVDPGGAIAALCGSYGWLAYLTIVVGVTQLNVLNVYSAYMCAVTAGAGFRGMTRVPQMLKFVIMAVVVFLSLLIAVKTQYHFEAYFSDIVIGQLYVLVPWSSINLVDFYAVRRGRYSIDDIFNKSGIYGAWNVGTIAVYLLTLVICAPFYDLSFYHGLIARAIGADITWIPALIVPGVLYWALYRGLAVVDKRVHAAGV